MPVVPILFLFLLAPFLFSCGEEHAHAENSLPQETGIELPAGNSVRSPSSLPSAGKTAPQKERSFSDHLFSKGGVAALLSELSDSAVLSSEGNAVAPAVAGPETLTPDAVHRRLSPISYHRGANHAHIHQRGHGYGSAASAGEHDWLQSIGANAISITPFGFQRGAKSDNIVGFGPDETPGSRDGSMTLDDMAAEVDSAHRRGLRVMLKPHIWSHDFWDGTEWHGTIDQPTPEAHRRWWACYRKLILYYAEFAERSGIDYFCVGTELVQMTTKYPDEWRALIADVGNVFKGGITYAAHWDHEWREIAFWDRLDYIGIGAYFPLNAPDSATVEQLATAWKPYRRSIDSIAAKFGRPVLFVEFGYRAVAGTWRQPWLYEGGTNDPDAQGRAFEAMFRAFEDDQWFRGVYVWKTFTDDDMARRVGEQTGFAFKGLPGERALQKWWGREKGR